MSNCCDLQNTQGKGKQSGCGLRKLLLEGKKLFALVPVTATEIEHKEQLLTSQLSLVLNTSHAMPNIIKAFCAERVYCDGQITHCKKGQYNVHSLRRAHKLSKAWKTPS